MSTSNADSATNHLSSRETTCSIFYLSRVLLGTSLTHRLSLAQSRAIARGLCLTSSSQSGSALRDYMRVVETLLPSRFIFFANTLRPLLLHDGKPEMEGAGARVVERERMGHGRTQVDETVYG